MSTETEIRSKNLQELRSYQKDNLEKIGIKTPFIVPKISFTPYGMDENHVSLFKSEVQKECDIFIEFTNRMHEPVDLENRTVYKYRYNPHYASEYQTMPVNNETTEVRYLVPTSELEVVWKKTMDIPKKTISTKALDGEINKYVDLLPNPDQDLPISQLTILDLAAMLMRKPISKKKFLNDAIIK